MGVSKRIPGRPNHSTSTMNVKRGQTMFGAAICMRRKHELPVSHFAADSAPPARFNATSTIPTAPGVSVTPYSSARVPATLSLAV